MELELEQEYEPTAADWLAMAELSVELGLDDDLDPEVAEAAKRGNVQTLIKTFGKKWAKGRHPHAACVSALRGKVRNPAALCAWLKDRSIGTTKWRGKEGQMAKVKGTGEALTESCEIRGMVEGTQVPGREWDIRVIVPGVSKNGVWYEPAVLREAVAKYHRVFCYDRHGNGEARSFRERIGHIQQPVYEIREGEEALWARLIVTDPGVREKLLEVHEAGELHTVGFSHDVIAESEMELYPPTKRRVKKAKRIEAVNSVDMVERPSAGGRMARLVAGDAEGDMDLEEIKAAIAESVAAAMAEANKGFAAAIKEAMTVAPPAPAPNTTASSTTQDAQIQVLTEASATAQAANDAAKVALREATKERQRGAITRRLTETKLSEVGKTHVMRRFEEWLDRRIVEDAEIEALVQEQIEYEALFAQSDANPNAPNAVRFQSGTVGREKFVKDLRAMFQGPQDTLEPGVRAFTSFKEAYVKFTGNWDTNYYDMLADYAPRGGYISSRDHTKIQESLQTADWAQIFADVMYQQLIAAYTSAPWYNQWRQLCSSIQSVPDFRTQHWMRIGGYGDLPAVGEGATYTTTTSPTDEEQTYAVSKRGFLDDITMEAIANDQVGTVTRLPTEMGRAAARTLYKFVMNLVTTDNPTMGYDSVALYNAAHGNTGTTALTIQGLYTTRQLMYDQTGFGQSLEILGDRNRIKFLIVPNELTGRAERILNPSDSYLYAIASPADTETVMDPTMFRGAGITPITYHQLTDATDWWAVADPNMVATLVVGFLAGRQEPELFVQDQPQNGSMFTADKLTWKTRYVFGGAILEHRSFFRQVVA